MKQLFRRFSAKISKLTGTASAFVVATGVIIIWAASGPTFNFSDTWQLIINTGTTIVTFLMVFLIQNTQNRDSKAMQLKLDELILATKSASDTFIDLEDLSDEDLRSLSEEFKKLHEKYSNQPSHALHKWHKKVAAEHQRRQKVT